MHPQSVGTEGGRLGFEDRKQNNESNRTRYGECLQFAPRSTAEREACKENQEKARARMLRVILKPCNKGKESECQKQCREQLARVVQVITVVVESITKN